MALGLDDETLEKGVLTLQLQKDEIHFTDPPATPGEMVNKSCRIATDLPFQAEIIHSLIQGAAPKASMDMEMRHFTSEQLAKIKAHFGKCSCDLC